MQLLAISAFYSVGNFFIFFLDTDTDTDLPHMHLTGLPDSKGKSIPSHM